MFARPGWSDFPKGGGAPGLPYDVLLHPCLHHHVIVMNSEALACMMSQNMCTADHNISSIIALMLYPARILLPAYVFHIPCIHNLPFSTTNSCCRLHSGIR
jgi:hypothetical protein